MSPHRLICRRKCNWVGVSVEPKHHSHFTTFFFFCCCCPFLPHPRSCLLSGWTYNSKVNLLGSNLHFPCLKWILGIKSPYSSLHSWNISDWTTWMLFQVYYSWKPHRNFRQTASNNRNTDKTDFNEKATEQQLRQKWSWYWSAANTLLFRFNVYVFRILHDVP